MVLSQWYTVLGILAIGAGACREYPSAVPSIEALDDAPQSPSAMDHGMPHVNDAADDAPQDAAADTRAPERSSDGDERGSRDAAVADHAAWDASPDSGGFEVDPDTLHLIAFGDYGSGEEAQFAVALAMEHWCDRYRCDAALTLGDNIYDDGIASPCDPLLEARFEIPYANLDFPFHIVVGNHDRGSSQNLTAPIEHMLAYASAGETCGFAVYGGHWTMPSRFYVVETELAVFIALDTTLFGAAGPESGGPDETDLIAEQADMASAALAEADASGRWKIVFGHQPYPPWGETQESLRQILCAGSAPRADVYLAGHNHHLRHMRAYRCEIDALVSGGGGAELEPLEDGPRLWGESTWGFTWLELSRVRARMAFVNHEGRVRYEYEYRRE